MPTTASLLASFKRILKKHVAANKTANFALHQEALVMPIMNPSPREIAELLAQHLTLSDQQ